MRNGLMETIRQRRSVRNYADKPVSRDLIMECLEAVRFAPSACHVQPWKFLIIDDPDQISALSEVAFSGIYKPTRFAAKAPVLAVLLTEFDLFVQGAGRQIQGTQYHLLDAGIAGEHFVLRAAELGLGTCWIGWYNRRKVRKFLKLSRRYNICALLSLGWPAGNYQFQEKERKPLSKIAWFRDERI